MNFADIVEKIMCLSRSINAFFSRQRAQPGPDTAEGPERTEQDFPPILELEAFLRSLSPGVLYLLVAILYVGEGYFGGSDLLTAYEWASNKFGRPRLAVDELMDDPWHLAGKLAYGIELLYNAGVEPTHFQGTWYPQTRQAATNNGKPQTDE